MIPRIRLAATYQSIRSINCISQKDVTKSILYNDDDDEIGAEKAMSLALAIIAGKCEEYKQRSLLTCKDVFTIYLMSASVPSSKDKEHSACKVDEPTRSSQTEDSIRSSPKDKSRSSHREEFGKSSSKEKSRSFSQKRFQKTFSET